MLPSELYKYKNSKKIIALTAWDSISGYLAEQSNVDIVLVGDSDQLPSVGSGNLLSDLIHSPLTKVVRLDTIFRQAKESTIITTAHNILKGFSDPPSTINSFHHLNKEDDFNFIEVEDPEKITQAIIY